MRILLIACLIQAPCYADEIELIGVGVLPGTASDRSGLKGKQLDGTPHDRLGGHGSGIAYSGRGNEFVLVSDRGPKDGATDYACRFHRMDIVVRPGQNPAVTLKVTGTTLLTTETGEQLLGSLNALDARHPERSRRFDPEAIRVGPAGQIYISDEYGPAIAEFDRNGRRTRVLPVPEKFRPAMPSTKPEEELPPRNKVGRQPNRGLESLAISADGKRLITLLQSPLLQDGALAADGSRIGRHARMAIINGDSQIREHIYVLDDPAHGTNELLSVNDHAFLVIERDSRPGKEAKAKRIYWVDIDQASDVANLTQLPGRELPESVRTVNKRLFIDLLDKKFGIVGPDCPEKFEGLAFGPDLPDGRTLLLVTADNDFLPDVPFRVYAFAIPRRLLPGLQPQIFPK